MHPEEREAGLGALTRLALCGGLTKALLLHSGRKKITEKKEISIGKRIRRNTTRPMEGLLKR